MHVELAPEALQALRGLDGAVWLEPRLRELVEVRTAQLDGAVDELVRHARAAIELGETQRRLADLAGWRDSPRFTERERAALALADALAVPADREALAAASGLAAAKLAPEELAQVVAACVAAGARDRVEVALAAAARAGEERSAAA